MATKRVRRAKTVVSAPENLNSLKIVIKDGWMSVFYGQSVVARVGVSSPPTWVSDLDRFVTETAEETGKPVPLQKVLERRNELRQAGD